MSLSSGNPFDNPDAWDTFKLGIKPTPGRCEVTGFKRTHDWDKKQGKGAAGATTTIKGKPPASGKVKFWLWLPEHFAFWDENLPIFFYYPEKKQPVFAIDVYHPALAALEIASVVVEHVSAIEHEGKGLYSFEVQLLEYKPPPKGSAVATPGQSKDGSNPDAAKPDPQIVALQAMRDAAVKEAQAAYKK